jgi:predicted transcriptional regulator
VHNKQSERTVTQKVEAIEEYFDVCDWQISAIEKAITSLDSRRVVAHDDVKDWIASWGMTIERPTPRAKEI